MKVRKDGIVEQQEVSVTDSIFEFEWDEIQASYPSATQEVYEYYLNAVLVKTITVDYSSSAKTQLTSVTKA